MYGVKIGRITDKYEKKIETVEMDTLRRSFCISRRERVRSDLLKHRMDTEGRIIEDIISS